MRNKSGLIIVIAILVFVGLVANAGYYLLKTDKGNFVFIKSEIISDNTSKFNLQFLSKIDPTEYSVVLPEISNYTVEWEMNQVFNKNGYNGYVINLNLDKYKLNTNKTFNEEIKTKDIVITKLDMINEKGKKESFNIGKVTLKQRGADIAQVEPLKYLVRGGTATEADGTTTLRYKLTKDVNFNVVNKNQIDELLKFGALKINGKNIQEITFPMKLKNTETLEFTWKSSKHTSFEDRISATQQKGINETYKIEYFTNYLDLSFCLIEDARYLTDLESYDAFIKGGKGEYLTWSYEMFSLPGNDFRIDNTVFNEMGGKK